MSIKSNVSKTLLVSTAVLMACATPALADAKDDRIAQMEAQMRMMMQEIATMKAERAAEKAQMAQQQATLKQQVETKIQAIETKTDTAVASIAPAAGTETASSDTVKVTMKGSTPKFQKGDFSWQPTGRIHVDAGVINDDKVDHPNSTEFRRARLGMKGTVAPYLGYKAEFDLAGDSVSAKDVYMKYTGVKNTDVIVGNFKPGYSLEESNSSNDMAFIERAAVVNSFTLDRKIGAGVINNGENYNLQVGAFGSGAGTQSNDDEEFSIAARLSGTPYNDGQNVIHVGASTSYRSPDQSNDRFDLDARGENRLQTADSVSSVINDADSAIFGGLEAGVIAGPFSAQAEYIAIQIDNRGGQDPYYQGAYGQVAYTVTGESRDYKVGSGSFGGIKPNKPLDVSKGDFGAVEVAARFSHLDLNDSGLNGGQMDNITFGVNWYLNNYMRMMANYIIVDTDNNASTPNDDPHIAVMRSQVKF